MHPTCHTSVQSSRSFPSTALRPSSHCTRTSGRGTPAGPAHPHGRLSMWVSTSVRSRRAARHGCVAFVEVATQRPSAGYGRAGIRSSQLRRWRETSSSSLLFPRQLNCHRSRPLFCQDVLLGGRHLRTEAPRAQWSAGTALLAGRVFGYVGGGRACRRRPRWCARFRGAFSSPLSLSIYLYHSYVNTCAQMMNEPHRGYIDLPSLHSFDYNTDLHLGDVRAYTHPTTQSTWAHAYQPAWHGLSLGLPVFPPRRGSSDHCRPLDAILPVANKAYRSNYPQPSWSQGLAR